MTETTLPVIEQRRRLHLDWVVEAIFMPRQAFTRIAAETRGVWFTPIMVLTLTAVLFALIAGPIKQQAAAMGTLELPPGYEWYTPEQQAQFQQAIQATQGPVFIYVFPALVGIAKVWLGWLIVGGFLHLVVTMLGGRGETGVSMNLVAWAALPFAIRDLVRVIAMLGTKTLIGSPGLSGFAPAGEGDMNAFLAALLSLVDIYVIWHACLLVLSVRKANSLSLGKTWAGVLITLVIVIALQALLAFLTTKLSGLTVARPFFF